MDIPEGEQRDGAGAELEPPSARPSCGCRICVPDEQNDDEERECIETVAKHGWQVMMVFEGEGPDEPAFGYTVGLMHQLDHPELVVSGLSVHLVHSVLNNVAERVMKGRRLAPGDALEGVLGYVPVLVEELNDVGLEDTVIWSRWLQRGPVPALQLVWPDTSARFAWQPGASPLLDGLQPPEWRRPLPHVGAFAPDPTWPFPVPAELEAVGCLHVVEHGATICHVTRRPGDEHSENEWSREEEWIFHCGELHAGPDDYALCHLSHLIRATPSLREVADLPLGEYAWRLNPDQPWKQSARGEHHPLMEQ